MEPIEINAGRWYLRALRADERVDDRPAIVAALADDELRRRSATPAVADLAAAGERVRRAEEGWAAGTRCTWAVCEPTTGEMLAEVGLALDPAGLEGEAGFWTAPEHQGRGVVSTALGAVLRLAFAGAGVGGLGLQRVVLRCQADDAASLAVARRCGFTPEPAAAGDELLLLARRATDPPGRG